MTSSKIFYAVLSFIFALVAVGAYHLTKEAPFGILFGFMSFVAMAKSVDLKDWFD